MFLPIAAIFIGSQPCHSAIAEAYAQKGMARSSGRTESIALPAADFTAAGHRYRIEANQLKFREGGKDVEVSMDFFIGSGAQGRTFVWTRDRYLFELPVTWYSRKKIWDASPGYEHESEVKLNRAVEPSCLFCTAAGRVRFWARRIATGSLRFWRMEWGANGVMVRAVNMHAIRDRRTWSTRRNWRRRYAMPCAASVTSPGRRGSSGRVGGWWSFSRARPWLILRLTSSAIGDATISR